MNRVILIALHRDICQNARDLMMTKSEDYSDSENVFANLDAACADDPRPGAVEHYILNRTYEKLHRLRNFIVRGKHRGDEKALSDIYDAINQLLLLSAKLDLEPEELDDGSQDR